ncbi:SIR2 family NAD-dependent protein deacylase [Enemella sp. A6]|uniref:SIR2 family NAD-dependent protein deacylase n=1 Tax=Enemella sp. A6 TaxID=3440152 RepID=UPI003EB7778C
MRADPVDLLAEAERITVLSGAGISTESGIQDFRGPQGLWTQNPKAELISHLDSYLGDPEVRRAAWQYRAASPVWQARPNPAHEALVELEKQGRLQAIITQNTDGLHQVAGNADDKVLEVHGSVREWQCDSCPATGPMIDQIERVRAGDPDPDCPRCGGITRATTILFGEMLVPEVLDAAFAAATDCDVLLTVGTSLTVQPVAGLVPTALSEGARAVIVNAEETPFDDWVHAVVRGRLGEVLPRLLGVAA